MHLKGHLPNFIKFSVRLLNQYSDEYEQETRKYHIYNFIHN